MSFHIKHFDNKEEWLKAKKDCISGTFASAIIGNNPWLTNVEAFNQIIKPKLDDKQNSSMKLGTELEPLLRQIFAILYSNVYKVDNPCDNGYDLIINDKYEWLVATLDGTITELATNRKGIYEGKTATIRFNTRESWKESIPINYYVQVLHYLFSQKLISNNYFQNVKNLTILYYFLIYYIHIKIF